MRTLSDQEKRTVRLASVVLAAGLLLAGGLWCGRRLQARRAAYRTLLVEAQDVRDEIDRYQDKAAVAQKLIDNFHLDPMTLARTSLVAQASSAIQKASSAAGVAAGSIRETPAHGAGKEIASIQFEGTGPVPAVMALLYQLERAGAPLIVDSVRITGSPRQPGAVKVNLTIVVLDFEQWKAEGPPHA
jgi:hypothetical protein